MKQSDIFTLILIAGIGTLAAFFLCNAIMGDPDDAKTEFKRLSNVISADLSVPDPEIFNSTAINPTIEVYVGDCEDIDHNGMLDRAELIACGKEDVDAVTEEMTREEIEALLDSEKCIVTITGETKCDSEKRTYLTTLLQTLPENVE